MAELFFGDYRLDTKQLTLEGAAGPVECRAMTLQLLLFLIERRNRFVSRAELVETLWPGSVGGPSSLNQCISELRRILGDSAREPRYIETRVKLGYRFVAPLFHKPTEKLEPLPPPPEIAGRFSQRSPAGHRLLVLLALVGLALVASVIFFLVRAGGSAGPTTVFVAAPECRDQHPSAVVLAGKVHAAILDLLARNDRLTVSSTADTDQTAEHAHVEIRCRSIHDVRIELSVILQRSRRGERVWGWTWVVPVDRTDVDGTVNEIAAAVASEVSRMLLP